ncbi:MAG: hypothetical protein QCI00_05870 [Candidatus Thermoplasmatota archaeon]|nr:hypothetical protein [Candidatus Thermoplasmatota archaeon]
MDGKRFVIGIVMIILAVGFSGCTEQGVTVTSFENIDFESDVVELETATLDFIKDDDDYGGVRSVEFKYILHNPLDRYVSVQVYVTFYDQRKNELHTDGPYTINLPAGYTESEWKYAGEPPVTLAGSLARAVDHVRITAYEI